MEASARADDAHVGLVDAHVHLDAAAFDADRDEVWARARAAGVERMLIAGVLPGAFAGARALVADRGWVAVGLHPYALAGLDAEGIDAALAELAERAETADAIGEFGLDAPLAERGGPSLGLQRATCRRLLRIASRSGRPVVLHVVGAHEPMLADVADEAPDVGGMVHGFGGSAELATRWLRAGFHLSFGPTILDPGRRKAREAARVVPLERLLVESDAPDGGGLRRAGRVEPSLVRDVVETLAALRDEPFERIAAVTRGNALRLFTRA